MNSGHNAIAGLIPHQGDMCLLDQVIACDGDHIVCRATGHRSGTHPLRDNGVLPAICGIEYGAQAVAVHGAMQGGGQRSGVLAAARDVTIAVERLDDIPEDLVVSAHRLAGDSRGVLYTFALHAGGRELMRGRVAVALDSAEPA